MPRLVAALVPTVVQRLTELHLQVQQSHRAALDYARQAGELLRGLPKGERAAAAAAAGIEGRSTRFVYVQVSEHWELVQHAGSIRQALKIIKETRQPGKHPPLPFEERCVVTQHKDTGWCVDDGGKRRG
jgi:hypothetical protein